ncbi:MAG: DUF86 domain-containing protein [Desulfobacterales bacterium]|nr:DUF86 domain-containing protein [Desulfobacterales bacterium]
MLDREVVESKLRFLREYLSDLKEYRSISLNDYQTKKKDQRFVERTLHLVCECCLDIAAHIISRKGLREPRDNKDLFVILFENNIISEPVHHAMVKMAGFRNIIVHDYARIEPEIVIGILKKDMGDFKEFAKEIIQYVDDQDI